jgi:hypothetical protein
MMWRTGTLGVLLAVPQLKTLVASMVEVMSLDLMALAVKPSLVSNKAIKEQRFRRCSKRLRGSLVPQWK